MGAKMAHSQFTQECDAVYNGINKSDMNKEHLLEMIKQLDAVLATNPGPGIVALGKEGNVQQAIKLRADWRLETEQGSAHMLDGEHMHMAGAICTCEV
jgi:hypothetical protein